MMNPEIMFGKLMEIAGGYKATQPVTDVVINIYGKPWNTAATLYSLLKHSGQWIDKIYFITERKQPHKSDFGFIKQALGNRIVSYTPGMWLWVRPFRNKLVFSFPGFRKSVRYQYGWENTDKEYLFVTHNDVLYTGDLLGNMLRAIGNNIGIGPVGQCWNCSANFAGLCTPDEYTKYKPTYNQLTELLRQYPGSRQKDYGKLPHKERPWPLPECRLNEWTALINMTKARPATMPVGNAIPFGAFYELDIATKWFSDVLNMGHTVANFDITPFAQHAWAGNIRSGHAALLDMDEYTYSENVARDYMIKEYTTLHDRNS
jgi:hypothetical protein